MTELLSVKQQLKEQIDNKRAQIQPIIDEIAELQKKAAELDEKLFMHSLSHPVELKQLLNKYKRWYSEDWSKIKIWTDIDIVFDQHSSSMYDGQFKLDTILTVNQSVCLVKGCAEYDVKIGKMAYRGHIKFTNDELKLLAKYGLGVRHGTRSSGN